MVIFLRARKMKNVMNQFLFGAFLLVASLQFGVAQSVPYRVVIDVTSPDTMVHHMVIRWVKGITSSHPDSEIIVVFYAKALDMVLKGESVVTEAVQIYSKLDNVKFEVCALSLKRKKIDKSNLLKGVITVPDAIYEIISRQQDGWGYIKATL